MTTLFIGTAIVSVALGARGHPTDGFIFFGLVCIFVGVVQAAVSHINGDK